MLLAPLLVFLSSICLAGALISDAEMTLTLRIDPGKNECFFFPVKEAAYRAMEMNYRVVRGGAHDINLSIKVPSGVEVVNDYRATSQSHRIHLDGTATSIGDYEICLDNSFSFNAEKTVAISVYLMDEDGNYFDENPIVLGDELTKLIVAADKFQFATSTVKSNLNKIESEQEKMRTVSLADRSRAEDNFENVNFWGILNTVVMVVAAITQVFLVRSLLTDRSKVGSLLRKGFH